MTTQEPQGPPPGMGGAGAAGAPSEEEMQAALDEQMRRLTVPDVIIQTVVTLINLGARKLGLTGAPEDAAERDLEQARMAIEGTRALLPLVPAEVGQIREALSQLQMAYAREAGGQGPAAAAEASGAADAEPAPPGPDPAAPDEEAERAKARAKIWTPGSG